MNGLTRCAILRFRCITCGDFNLFAEPGTPQPESCYVCKKAVVPMTQAFGYTRHSIPRLEQLCGRPDGTMSAEVVPL